MRTGRSLLLALNLASCAFSLASATAFAQERGSEVGGAPARRRITKAPVLKRFVEAEYPEARKAAGTEGVVVLTISISDIGDVVSVTVAQSAGQDFDDAAVAAARKFEFSPAEVDDKPAPSRITYRYAFTVTPAPAAPEPSLPPPAAPQASKAPEAPAEPEPPKSDEVKVRALPRARRDSAQVTVNAEQARRIAGTQGDVLKVVQNLPGVSRPPLASGQLVVWGSAPNDTRVYVDGVEIPALYHGSGLRSVVNSDLVSSVDLTPGAFGAEYGRSLGGMVRVETRALRKEGITGYVGADTLDASALTSAALSDRVRVAVAGRYSYLDGVLSAVSAPDIGDFFPIPRYRDYQAKATVDLRKNESIDVVFLGSHDDLTRTVPSPDPARTKSEATASRFHRLYLRYTYVTDDNEALNVTPFAGYDESDLGTAFGGTPTRLDVGSWKYGIRTSYRTRIHRSAMLTAGLDALGSSSNVTRYGSLTLPPREGDVTVFGQPPGDEVSADSYHTDIVNVGPHISLDVPLGPVTVTPGVRLDTFLLDGSRSTPRVGLTPAVGFSRMEGAVDPRLSIRYQATPRLAVTASGGTYHQPPAPEDLSAVFGTPALGLSRAVHASLGESLRISESLSAEITGFVKQMSDLVVRSRLTTPKLARVLVQNGEGESYGVQFLLRQEMWKGFFGWFSYTISRSERSYTGDPRARLFDFDQPHVLAVVLSQQVDKWTFGVRFRYASGAPRTPVVGSFYDARGDGYQPIFGDQNSTRLPAFAQLDAKVERLFPLGSAVKLVVFVDAQNLTFTKNREEVVYSPDYRKKDYISGLPFLAVIGGRVEF